MAKTSSTKTLWNKKYGTQLSIWPYTTNHAPLEKFANQYLERFIQSSNNFVMLYTEKNKPDLIDYGGILLQ